MINACTRLLSPLPKNPAQDVIMVLYRSAQDVLINQPLPLILKGQLRGLYI